MVLILAVALMKQGQQPLSHAASLGLTVTLGLAVEVKLRVAPA